MFFAQTLISSDRAAAALSPRLSIHMPINYSPRNHRNVIDNPFNDDKHDDTDISTNTSSTPIPAPRRNQSQNVAKLRHLNASNDLLSSVQFSCLSDGAHRRLSSLLSTINLSHKRAPR